MPDWLEQNGTPEADWLAQNGQLEQPPGPPEEPGLQSPPWWADPVDAAGLLLAGPTMGLGRAVMAPAGALAEGVGSAAGRVMGGMGRVLASPRAVAIGQALATDKGPIGTLARVGQAAFGQAARTLRPAVQPIVGQAENRAFREGGQEALDALRASGGGGGIAAHEARAAAQPVEQAAQAIPEGKTIVREHVRTLPKPKPKPKLKVVSKAEVGSAESRIPKPKHEVQYYSESKGTHVNIEDMNQKHIEQAYKKLAAKNPKPGSVAAKQMDALMAESKYRAQTSGIHIGQAESRAIKTAKPSKPAPRRNPSMGNVKAEVPGSLEAQLRQSNQIQAEMDRLGLTPEQQMVAWQQLRQMNP